MNFVGVVFNLLRQQHSRGFGTDGRAMEKQAGQQDTDRELNSIGLQNSTRMGIYLSNQPNGFDIIISSPAVRAKTTAMLLAEQIKYDTHKVHLNPEIYEASIRTLLRVVNQLKDEWNNVLIVGHNPSITYLAEYLTKSEIGNMTTCGLASIGFHVDEWEEVSEGTGDLLFYQYPDLLNF
ncbi:MAG: histidine phosphatase family protein, partial [Bacteroidota bacterium]